MYTKEMQTKKNKQPKLRKRKCKHCKEWFEPERQGQDCCTIEHALEYAKVKTKKHQEQTKKAFRQKDKSKLREKAQMVFNAYIRERDKDKPCISCDYDWKANANLRQAHASHYMAVGKSEKLRFNEYNVHKSCSICNSHLSGNLNEYRPRLIKKIGLEKVEELERVAKESTPCKYTEEDYKKIVSIYTQKIKELK